MMYPEIGMLASEVKQLYTARALHRKGYRIGEVPLERITEHLVEEANELNAEPDDIKEAGDVLSLLLQVCQYNGWDLNWVARTARYKLRQRFIAADTPLKPV